jgi:hypothetical protein
LEQRSLFKWGELAAQALTPIVNRHLSTAHLLTEAEIQPIVSEKQSEFAQVDRGEWLTEIRKRAVMVTLYHRLFEPDGPFFGWSAQQLQAGNTLLAQAFRVALSC